MSWLFKGLIGPQKKTDGTEAPLYLGYRGEAMVQQRSARYLEAVRRGRVFAASVAIAGVDHGTTIDTAPLLTLQNPQNSQVLLAVHKLLIACASGVFGVGTFALSMSGPNVAAPTGGTGITPVNQLIGSALKASGVALQAPTLAAAPTLIRPSVTVVTSAGTGLLMDEIDAEIVVYPGSILSVDFAGLAGTTPRAIPALTWEEVDLPSAA